MAGNMWKILVQVGDAVAEEQEVAILESMKMEIPIESDFEGTVTEIRIKEGDFVNEGDVIVVLD
jgi:acetyl-CoA carboxylase biotin carboxyl carrier protein